MCVLAGMNPCVLGGEEGGNSPHRWFPPFGYFFSFEWIFLGIKKSFCWGGAGGRGGRSVSVSWRGPEDSMAGFQAQGPDLVGLGTSSEILDRAPLPARIPIPLPSPQEQLRSISRGGARLRAALRNGAGSRRVMGAVSRTKTPSRCGVQYGYVGAIWA